jgi:hypothetical protein
VTSVSDRNKQLNASRSGIEQLSDIVVDRPWTTGVRIRLWVEEKYFRHLQVLGHCEEFFRRPFLVAAAYNNRRQRLSG